MDFHSKQRAAFAKHECGTIQWLLDSVPFREWAFGPNCTTLWCPGIRQYITYPHVFKYKLTYFSGSWKNSHDVSLPHLTRLEHMVHC